MNDPTLDAGIPVLTEIIEAPSAPDADVSAIPLPQPKAEVQPAETAPLPPYDEEKWAELERDIRERVLQQMLERIDFVLEQRVRDNLADVLQTAVEGLADQIRSGLHQTMKDVVTRAVTQELAKARTFKK